jgi:hypothetical protein
MCRKKMEAIKEITTYGSLREEHDQFVGARVFGTD